MERAAEAGLLGCDGAALGVHHLASIDVEGLSGDVFGVRRGEESGHGGDFLRSLPFGDWGNPAEFLFAPGLEVLSF